jgi:hypothetical protein
VFRRTDFVRDETDELGSGMSGVLLGATVDLLVTQVVADLVDPRTFRLGFGPWQAALSSTGMTPGPEWEASVEVLAHARSLVATLGVLDLVSLAHAHLDRPGDGDWLVMRLRGLAVTRAAGSPPASRLLSGTPVARALERSETLDFSLTEWLCCVTALLSERPAFTDEQVASFCLPTRQLVPGLEEVLNEPLVARAG